MKQKLIILFLLILIISIIFIGTLKKQNNTINFVFKESNTQSDINKLVKNEYDFNNFYLSFDNYSLSTQNIIALFSFFENRYEYHIISIYPKINNLYSNTLKNINISYNGNNLLEGMDNFYHDYLQILYNYNLNDEIEKVYKNGIGINKILINTSNIAIYNFIKQYKNIKYSIL